MPAASSSPPVTSRRPALGIGHCSTPRSPLQTTFHFVWVTFQQQPTQARMPGKKREEEEEDEEDDDDGLQVGTPSFND